VTILYTYDKILVAYFCTPLCT